MKDDKAVVLDVTDSEDYTRLLSRVPLQYRQQTHKNQVFLAHYQIGPHECLKHYFSQHLIWLNLNHESVPLHLESQLAGRATKHLISNGSIGIVPANTLSWAAWDNNAEFLVLTLVPEYLEQVALSLGLGSHIELIPQVAIRDALIEHIALALKTDMESGCTMGSFYNESLTATLAVHLLKNYSVRKPQLANYTEGLSSNKLQLAIEYIHLHLEENIKLAELANAVGISQFYFIRLFKQSTGMTPYNYIIQQRIERAKQLLQEQDLTVGEIATKCGFTDQSHFTRYFKRHFGITPQAMRSIHLTISSQGNCLALFNQTNSQKMAISF